MRLRPATGVTLTLLFLSLSIMMFTVEPVSSSSTVHNINTDLDYATIQEAIDAPETSDGHTIQVDAGTYYEHVIVDKSLTLVGEDESTIVDGNGTGTVFYITADNVQLDGFTIQNAREGIWIKNSDGHTIRYSTITTNRNEGIIIQNSSDNIIDRNTINSNGWEGIYIEKSPSGNVISGNTISSNGFDGICTLDSNGDVIIGNTITSNDWNGISLQNSLRAALSDNIISQNGIDGLHLLDSSGNTASKNIISSNNACGIGFNSSSDNTFYHNNIINNTRQVDSDGSSNIWDNGAEGNYWSDYNATDLNGDGIGDTSYIIDANNTDNYPLIDPWSLLRVFSVTSAEETYYVTTFSNSTIASFNFNQLLEQINFKVTGPSGTLGFCNITIPKGLLSSEPPKVWKVTVDGLPMSFAPAENVTHTSLYFTYGLTSLNVQIGIVEVQNLPPTADFTYSPTNPTIYDTISFTDTSNDPEGNLTSWFWEFADSINSTDPNPTHKYADKGTYVVKLTVADNVSATSTKVKAIIVQNLLPVADFTHSPANPAIGQNVQFTDNSTDPEGKIATWLWDFGDGNKSAERNPSHKFASAETYTVTLTVADDEEATNTTSKAVTVRKLGTTLTIDVPPTATQGKTITMTATLRDENGILIPNRTIEFYLLGQETWEKIGSDDTGSNGVAEITYSPPATGEFQVKATFAGTQTYAESSNTQIVTVIPPEEAFPFWIVVAVVVVIGITIVAAFLWKRK